MKSTTIVATAIFLAASVFSASAVAETWEYKTSTDKMTDKQLRLAHLKSSNSLHLDSPYSGENHGTITIRQHPQHGLDVMVDVDKGQIMCSIGDGCQLKIRIDGEKAKSITFAPADSGRSDIVFARNPRPLLAELRKAKKILVQVPMFHAGDQLLEFEADKPLEWEAPAPKAASKSKK